MLQDYTEVEDVEIEGIDNIAFDPYVIVLLVCQYSII